jgi:hypothetical protein
MRPHVAAIASIDSVHVSRYYALFQQPLGGTGCEATGDARYLERMGQASPHCIVRLQWEDLSLVLKASYRR